MIDQDQNETAQISGSDFAQMCDEMKQLRAELATLTAENERLATGNHSMEKEIPQLRHAVVRLRAALEGMMEAEMALNQAEGWGADEVGAAPHWKAAREALATSAQ